MGLVPFERRWAVQVALIGQGKPGLYYVSIEIINSPENIGYNRREVVAASNPNRGLLNSGSSFPWPLLPASLDS